MDSSSIFLSFDFADCGNQILDSRETQVTGQKKRAPFIGKQSQATEWPLNKFDACKVGQIITNRTKTI